MTTSMLTLTFLLIAYTYPYEVVDWPHAVHKSLPTLKVSEIIGNFLFSSNTQ
jgi:hypothetical protein